MSGVVATSLSFFGGVHEIGGNTILMEDGDAKILFDFGKNFRRFGMFFSYPFNLPTNSVELELVKTGIVPQIKTSRGDVLDLLVSYESGEVKEPNGRSALSDVIISHSHSDHIGNVSLLRSDLNIRMGLMTDLLYSTAILTRRGASLEDRLYWSSAQEHTPRLKVKGFTGNETIKVDSVRIIPYPVDHSVPGAYGFIIESSSGRIAYTGDLRTHGYVGKLTEVFIEEAASEPLEMLICEGTNMNYSRVGSEEQIRLDASRIIDRSAKQGNRFTLVEVRSNDIDRISTFFQIAQEKGMKVSVTTRLAYLLNRIEAARLDKRLQRKLPKVKDVEVVAKRKRYYESWERELDENGIVTTKATDFLRVSEPTMLIDTGTLDIFETPIPKGSLYIQSTSEHIDEEGAFEEERLINTLALNGVICYRLHCSGHMDALEIERMIRACKAKKVLPIHTLHPETFSELFGANVIQPRLNEPIYL